MVPNHMNSELEDIPVHPELASRLPGRLNLQFKFKHVLLDPCSPGDKFPPDDHHDS